MLSRLYYYSTVSYVGGGFSKDGIHNVLEPAAFGKPVIFGPNYIKYREAKDLIDRGAAYSITTAQEFKNVVNNLHSDIDNSNAGKKAKEYVSENGGASQKMVDFIQENRLLTS